MQWIMSNPKSNRIGHTQEQSIIKWKWYISERAKQGEGGVASLHEKIADIPTGDENPLIKNTQLEGSPVKWGKPYLERKLERRKWRSVVFNPPNDQNAGNGGGWKEQSIC